MSKLKKAEQARQALIQMYQAGFLDGYNESSGRLHKFGKTMKARCIKAFGFRFVEANRK